MASQLDEPGAKASVTVDSPVQAVLAGLVLIGIAVIGFLAASDAQEGQGHDGGPVLLFALSGLLGAAFMGTASFRLLRRASSRPTRPSEPRDWTRWGAGVGFGIASALLALTGPVASVLFGVLFGVVGALGFIATGRGIMALARRPGCSARL